METRTIVTYFVNTFKNGVSGWIFYSCFYLVQNINLIFISTYKEAKLISAVGTSHLYVNIMCMIITSGIQTGIDILGAGHFTNKNYRELGLTIHRSRLISFSYLLVISILNYIFARNILEFFKIDADVLEPCLDYLYINIAVSFIENHLIANFRICCVFRQFEFAVKLSLTTLLLHFLWCWILIIYCELGVIGAGCASIITQLLNSAILHFYLTYKSGYPEAFIWLQKESFEKLYEYLQTSIPSTILMIAEWSGYEIQTIIAIQLGPIPYAVHIILSSIHVIVFQIVLGFCIPLVSVIASKIASREKKEKISEFIIYTYLSFIFSFSVICLSIYTFRSFIISLYSAEEGMYFLGRKTIIYLCFYEIFSASYYYLITIFRGINYMWLPSFVSIIYLLIIQVIFSLLLGYYFENGISGIWISMILTNLALVITLMIILTNAGLDKLKSSNNENLIDKQKITQNQIILELHDI